jgi:hypothetical protein
MLLYLTKQSTSLGLNVLSLLSAGLFIVLLLRKNVLGVWAFCCKIKARKKKYPIVERDATSKSTLFVIEKIRIVEPLMMNPKRKYLIVPIIRSILHSLSCLAKL